MNRVSGALEENMLVRVCAGGDLTVSNWSVLEVGEEILGLAVLKLLDAGGEENSDVGCKW